MLIPRMRRLVVIVLFNAVLAAAMQALAPAQPRMTDRNDYEYTGRHPLDANCPNTIYCYRILVPVLLEQVPMDPERRWRGLQWLAHSTTGALVAMATAPIGSPLIASVLLQTSYAFTFTAYDPYTADPVVFLISALILYLWLVDRAFTVAVVAALGVFAKETVALVASVPAFAVVLWSDRSARWRWLVPAALAWPVLLGFHWYMDTYAGWGISKNAAASFETGSWLGDLVEDESVACQESIDAVCTVRVRVGIRDRGVSPCDQAVPATCGRRGSAHARPRLRADA